MFKNMRYVLSICLLYCDFSAGSVFAQTSQPPTRPTESQSELVFPRLSEIIQQNFIHLGDLIDVDVLGSTEFDWRGTLTPEGYLDGVDFVEEPIFALCRSEKSVASDIVNGFKKILRNPQVVVTILDRSGRPLAYLYGAVKTPHRFKIQREIRLNELIIRSGGITEKANGEIQIIRSGRLNCEEQKKEDLPAASNSKVRQEIGAKTLSVKIADLLKGDKDANPLVLSGDIITVLESDPIYVIGGVANPRQINARTQMTISRAIASAGGFAKGSDPKNITVFRREKAETKIIEVNFEQIKVNPAADIALQRFDIVEVRQVGGDKRKFPPIVKMADAVDKGFLGMPLQVID